MKPKKFGIAETLGAHSLPKKVELKGREVHQSKIEVAVEKLHEVGEKGASVKKKEEKLQRMTIDISKQLHRKLKMAAMLQDLTLREYISQHLEEIVEQEEK